MRGRTVAESPATRRTKGMSPTRPPPIPVARVGKRWLAFRSTGSISRFGSVQGMETHRQSPRSSDAERPRRRRSDVGPLDSAWLEREAVSYLARWEATEHGLTETLRKRLFARCERTGESPEQVEDAIGEVVSRLAAKGYVDDHRFAEHAFARARKDGRSRAQIHAQLRAKGVDSGLIERIELARASASEDETDGSEEQAQGTAAASSASDDAVCLEPIDEELAAAFRTARKRRIGPYFKDAERRSELRDKHLGVLARRGFSRETAYLVIESDLTPQELEERGR